MMRFFMILVFIFSISAAQAQNSTLTEAQKLSDLQQLMSLIESGYGPIQFKEQRLGISSASMKKKYEPLVRATRTNGEFYYLLMKLIAEYQDSHFGIYVPTEHQAELPISTDLVEGRALIDTVDRDKLSREKFPFERGDEIIAINGQPIKDTLDELQSYVASGYPPAARRIAAQMLFFRSGRRVPVPTGKVSIEIRRGTSKVIETAELDWQIKGQPVDEKLFLPQRFSLHSNHPTLHLLSDRENAESYLGRDRVERSFRCNGKTRIAIPKDATVIMKEPFVAYYHPTAKGNVGYLRIPHYLPMSADGKTSEAELRFNQYLYAIRILEANTVGLIIDQDHNCGGSVFWLEALLGLFMDRAYQPMQFRFLANKKEYLDFKKWSKAAGPSTDLRTGLEKLADATLKAWQAGDFMTPLMSMSGEAKIHPNGHRYTKPIVMLIDELSGSGGDAFPALMQGYGRATLFGTRTVGAGGHVTEQAPLFYSQMELRMTKSLFYRPDGVEVENNGAVPDLPYTITRDDFVYDYKGYQEAYLKALFERL